MIVGALISGKVSDRYRRHFHWVFIEVLSLVGITGIGCCSLVGGRIKLFPDVHLYVYGGFIDGWNDFSPPCFGHDTGAESISASYFAVLMTIGNFDSSWATPFRDFTRQFGISVVFAVCLMITTLSYIRDFMWCSSGDDSPTADLPLNF